MNFGQNLNIDESLLLNVLGELSEKGYLKVMKVKEDAVHIQFTDKSIEFFGKNDLTQDDLDRFIDKPLIIDKVFMAQKALEMLPRLRHKSEH